MRTDPHPEDVRKLVAEMFEQFGVSAEEVAAIDETILIDRRRYVARSYRTENYLAMWLLEVGILQFYDGEGKMLATINLFESFQPQRMAA